MYVIVFLLALARATSAKQSACDKLPDVVLGPDVNSPLGEPGESVAAQMVYSVDVSLGKVPLNEAAAKAWEKLAKILFEGGQGVGSISSFVLVDKHFVTQTGGKSDEVKDARNKNAFLGVWAYLTVAQSPEFVEFVNGKVEESAEFWASALDQRSAAQRTERGFAESTAGQVAQLRSLAWPVIRRWLLHEGILASVEGPSPGIRLDRDRWGCFAEVLGTDSWLVRDVEQLVGDVEEAAATQTTPVVRREGVLGQGKNLKKALGRFRSMVNVFE